MNIKKIIDKEIKEESKKLNLEPNEVRKVLNELFTFNQSKLLKSLGNQSEILDEKDALPKELWENLIENINESYNENPNSWEKELKEIKFQIVCFKYFTKKELTDLDEIEKKIKVEIKKYFSSLENYTDNENFKDRFFNLPFEILVNFVRYILNKSNDLNKKISISKKEVIEKIKELKRERKKVIDKISFISNKNVTTLNIKDIKKLMDYGVFYEDNFLNRGVNEYLYKLINHPEAEKNIIESFNSTFINDLRLNIESSNSYLSHISSIKNEETPEFFSETGVQIGRRFDNEIDALKDKDPNVIIDKDSIFKEPKGRLNPTFNWDENENNSEVAGEKENDDSLASSGGFSGGGSSGGGGSFTGPTGGEETVDLDVPEGEENNQMPTGDDGLPTDFGTPESNETSDESELETNSNDNNEKNKETEKEK